MEFRSILSRSHRKYVIGPSIAGEEWRAIPGFPDFEISDIGRLRDVIGLLGSTRNGRHAFNKLRNGDAVLEASRATFVLLAFVGPPPEGKSLARHLNDDAADDRLENLAWGSKSDNTKDAIRNGRLTRDKMERAWAARRKGAQ